MNRRKFLIAPAACLAAASVAAAPPKPDLSGAGQRAIEARLEEIALELRLIADGLPPVEHLQLRAAAGYVRRTRQDLIRRNAVVPGSP